MRVQSMSYIAESGVFCEPGDELDLDDPVALDFIARTLVKPLIKKKKEPEAVAVESPPVEFAIDPPAEQALSRRGRQKRVT